MHQPIYSKSLFAVFSLLLTVTNVRCTTWSLEKQPPKIENVIKKKKDMIFHGLKMFTSVTFHKMEAYMFKGAMCKKIEYILTEMQYDIHNYVFSGV